MPLYLCKTRKEDKEYEMFQRYAEDKESLKAWLKENRDVNLNWEIIEINVVLPGED